MNNMRYFLTSFLAVVYVTAIAQVQSGYVKTLGRPGHKGEALSGVTIRAKGAHNAVLSKTNGSFIIPMPGIKNGESFSLQQVQKSGYVLNEAGVIGRLYAFSDKTPITIVMASSKQLNDDKMRIENKAYAKAEKNYKYLLEQLEQQKNEKLLAEDIYRQKLKDLQNRYSKYESLISDLADHYAHTDYDDLNEIECQVNIAIENGELEKADSLLNQLGIQKRIDDISQRLLVGKKIMEQATKDYEAVLKQQQKDGEYLYQLYTIALGQFDNEKASYYIETRAKLDTTNVDWQLEAGQYLSEYLADFPKAAQLIERGLRNAKRIYGEQSEQTAWAYNKLAGVFDEQRNFNKSKELYTHAFEIRKSLYPADHHLIAQCYSFLGGISSLQGNFTEAMEYHQKALEIRKITLPSPHEELSQSFFNIGYIQVCTGHYAEGLENLQESLDMLIALHGEQYIHVADAYHNIGCVYLMIGNYDKADDYLIKAMNIRKQLLGENHPDVSESLNALGNLYMKKGNYQKTLESFLRALDIRLIVFGEMNRATATSYNNVGTAYSCLGDKEKEIQFALKSLELSKVLYEANNPELGIRYLNMANVYQRQNKTEEAMENVTQALGIFMSSYNGADHPNVAECYNLMGIICGDIGKDEEALEYHQKALDIRKRILGDKHYDTALSYNNIGYIYYSSENFQKAIEYFKIAYDIFLNAVGPNHPQIKSSLGNLDMAYKKYLAKCPNSAEINEEYQKFKESYLNEK